MESVEKPRHGDYADIRGRPECTYDDALLVQERRLHDVCNRGNQPDLYHEWIALFWNSIAL